MSKPPKGFRDYPTSQRKKRKVSGVLVRCLGPGKEHEFLSVDPKTNRICESCQAKVRAANLSFRNDCNKTGE